MTDISHLTSHISHLTSHISHLTSHISHPASHTSHLAGGFLVRSGQYLFGKRSISHSSYAGIWDIFGGHLEGKESPSDALKREFKEELGIIPSAFELFKVVEVPNNNLPEITRFYIYFITAWSGGEPNNCSDEHSEINWFYRNELSTLTLASSEYLYFIDEWEKSSAD